MSLKNDLESCLEDQEETGSAWNLFSMEQGHAAWCPQLLLFHPSCGLQNCFEEAETMSL